MTLAVFVDDPAVASWARDRVRAVADKHPSRVIFLDATHEDGTYHIGRPSAHGDWLELGVAKSSIDYLSSAIAALALPEAPTLLLWGGKRNASDSRFEPLVRRARSTICSTSLIDTDAMALRDLCTFAVRRPQIGISDLAYLRLAPWQECIAGFFDDPVMAGELGQLREIGIVCGSDAESYYLGSWFASRLGWSVTGIRTFTTPHGDTVDLKIDRVGTPRRIQRVTLCSERAHFMAEVGHDDPNAIVLKTSIGRSQRRGCGPLGGIDIASLVERAILQGSQDRVFRETLAMATSLLNLDAPHA
ncbi:MAG: glucose-6-phosphate dehydrogenase assembly protein OpcA [Vulcanimicrobiaceae bacterium]